MTTQVAETMTRQATVAEASQVEGRNGATQWALKLDIKDISQFPIPCFMSLEQAPQVLKGSTHLVTMRRGKTKQGKDGKYPSEYFWDLTGWDVQAPPAQAPAAQPPSATEKPQAAAPPAPVSWDAADTQSRISWAQAVNLAVAALGRLNEYELGTSPWYFVQVEHWANRFYPLIRKGPSPQEGIDPETLPWGTPQWPQKATDGASAPEEDKRAVLDHEHRKQKADEPDYSYFFAAAQEEPHKLRPPAALEKLKVGNWQTWENQHGEQALAEALKRLEE